MYDRARIPQINSTQIDKPEFINPHVLSQLYNLAVATCTCKCEIFWRATGQSNLADKRLAAAKA